MDSWVYISILVLLVGLGFNAVSMLVPVKAAKITNNMVLNFLKIAELKY